jgi:hypothetical protein
MNRKEAALEVYSNLELADYNNVLIRSACPSFISDFVKKYTSYRRYMLFRCIAFVTEGYTLTVNDVYMRDNHLCKWLAEDKTRSAYCDTYLKRASLSQVLSFSKILQQAFYLEALEVQKEVDSFLSSYIEMQNKVKEVTYEKAKSWIVQG